MANAFWTTLPASNVTPYSRATALAFSLAVSVAMISASRPLSATVMVSVFSAVSTTTVGLSAITTP